MKKTIFMTLYLVSVSFFANAGKIVIKNDSKYNISYGTSYPAVANPLGTSISPGQYVIFDLPDNVQSKVYVRRWSAAGAAKNVWNWVKRAATAVAPNKENAADFAKEAYRFAGEEIYERLAVAKVRIDPSLVAKDNIKVVHVENYEEGTDTIKATIIDAPKVDYPGSSAIDENVAPSPAPIEQDSLRKSQELVSSLGIEDEETLELYNSLVATASNFVASNKEYEKEFMDLMIGPASLPSPEAIEVLQDFMFGEPSPERLKNFYAGKK
ncbi:MAG: hypothetical protein Q8S31_08185 [Alphaproteobacteria bacterium]|nr:hypothetical protein [Alphaproteobacteria bacterium]